MKFLNRLKAFSRWHIERHLLAIVLRPEYRGETVCYGDWIMPESLLNTSSLCYCAGVGEDLDLEMTLIRIYGCHVFAFDPTPRSIAYVQRLAPDASRFTFLPVGLWSEDTTLRFYAPENPEHVSHSIVEDEKNRPFFDAQCRRISSLMKELVHTEIDLLKMNIEGAEYEVLQSILEDRIYPRIISLTFEGQSPFLKAISWTKRLRQVSYDLVGRKSWAVTYVRRQD